MKERRQRRNPKKKDRDLPRSKGDQEEYDGPVVFSIPEEWNVGRKKGRKK